jgi:hypothetical protein
MKQPQLALREMSPNQRFGIAWVTFALALAIHVSDEAAHDFLSTYNPVVRAIRARLPFLPLPMFTFDVWLTLLLAGILLLLCLSPFAFRGNPWLSIVARPLGAVVGVLNAALHISTSFYFHRCMPGVYSSPLLLIAAILLLATSPLWGSVNLQARRLLDGQLTQNARSDTAL